MLLMNLEIFFLQYLKASNQPAGEQNPSQQIEPETNNQKKDLDSDKISRPALEKESEEFWPKKHSIDNNMFAKLSSEQKMQQIFEHFSAIEFQIIRFCQTVTKISIEGKTNRFQKIREAQKIRNECIGLIKIACQMLFLLKDQNLTNTNYYYSILQTYLDCVKIYNNTMDCKLEKIILNRS
ncbi:hypothetical protein EDEG_00261 [Edhazardia aedis USNM 41457]|uniref:Uncharacterized protein n=1 Tax=Edhazardia aedis (strain USNM 41457) TaxID=1003232 RepID=J9DMP9_EDHAE|nr:hypothetical protein EDEG_00261 [Edhazardia aedis USNM 41457]|eukprot:EJW02607.1 hypothetical protein EDEG_00261 [Edhazardia aedis USNM 41457]